MAGQFKMRRGWAQVGFLMLLACGGLLVSGQAFGQGRGAGGGPGFGGGRGFGRGQAGRGGGPPGDTRFVEDREVFHQLLGNHEKIERKVVQRKDGVETLTESADPKVAQLIQEHVKWMHQRVTQVQPIRMRDPLFAELFRHAKKIEMKFENTPRGVKVTETSQDPYVAELIKAHADVVSLFVKKGFDEAHRNHEVPAAARNKAAERQVQGEVNVLLDAFAEFDRAYIPALALTRQGGGPATAQALERLARQWPETERVLDGVAPGDRRWRRAAATIEGAIAKAKRQSDADQFQDAHESLELIRESLLAARRDSQLPYALDVLHEFHEVMEDIVRPASELRADGLSVSDKRRFAGLLQQAQKIWRQVEATPFDRKRFQLDEARAEQLDRMIEAEAAALETLDRALQADDDSRILDAARNLKPGFAKVYLLFGRFPPVDGQFAPVD